jgi:hypothetical protein
MKRHKVTDYDSKHSNTPKTENENRSLIPLSAGHDSINPHLHNLHHQDISKYNEHKFFCFQIIPSSPASKVATLPTIILCAVLMTSPTFNVHDFTKL